MYFYIYIGKIVHVCLHIKHQSILPINQNRPAVTTAKAYLVHFVPDVVYSCGDPKMVYIVKGNIRNQIHWVTNATVYGILERLSREYFR